MIPRKPRLGNRPPHFEPCKHCSKPFQLTEWQVQNRSLICPACRDARIQASRDKKTLRELGDAERSKGYVLAQHLWRAWR